jgi:hypothetical protein
MAPHRIGKAEVVSSILTGSTILSNLLPQMGSTANAAVENDGGDRVENGLPEGSRNTSQNVELVEVTEP